MMVRTHSRTAFTLIEMLVVIAIIALLASILIPTVSRAMQRARATKCLSSLRQIGIGVANFASENQGGLPLVTNQRLGSSAEKQHWFDYLSEYVGGEGEERVDPLDRNSVFWGCPEWEGRDSAWNIPPQNGAISSTSVGYGMNLYPERPDNTNENARNDLEDDSLYSMEMIQHATARVLIGDSIDWHLVGGTNFANGHFGFAPWSPGDPRRHGRGANYLFFDLHAARLPVEKAHLYLGDPTQAGL